MFAHRAMKSDSDAMVELSNGLASRKNHVVGVGFPIWHSVTIDEVAIREPVTLRTRIMLTPQWVHMHTHASKRWCDDLGSFSGARKGARHQHVDVQLGVTQPPVTQTLVL